ncbi:MAG: hypothetical protein ACPLXP_02785 [Microgenomates group bacterium]
MRKLTVGQSKVLAEFCANFAVAWVTTGVVVPFFLRKGFIEFISSAVWGALFAAVLLIFALMLSRKVKI